MSSKKYKRTSTADLNQAVVQQLGGNLRGVVAVNTNAAARFLKFYDQTDPVVVGTTVPVLTVQLAASSMTSIFPTDGVNFKLGIAIAMTVSPADSATDAVGAGDIILTVLFE
jgi:hypothetical protein